MDLYSTALKQASESHFKKARQNLLKLLNSQPNHIDALILLGKVEFYLKKYKSSQHYFEMALTYNPANMEAYRGLEYYKERRWKNFLFKLSIFLFALFAFGLFFLYFIFNKNISLFEKNFSKQINSKFETLVTTEIKYNNKIIKEINHSLTTIKNDLQEQNKYLDNQSNAINQILKKVFIQEKQLKDFNNQYMNLKSKVEKLR